jgi:serine/threonine-protein phosphatase 6 regulatory ankyrin repeat subunit B
LLNNQANPHRRDHEGRTALLWAAARADAKMLALLINHRATHVCRDNHGNTMFIIAAANDNRDLLRAICTPFYRNSQFDINTPNKDGDIALIEAARRGFLESVKLLLDNGANVLHSNAAGRTALFEATEKGHKDVIDVLKTKEASIPPVYPYANAALQVLAVVPLFSRFLPARVPVRTREFDMEGNSAMMLAAENGQDVLLNDLFRTGIASESERYLEQSETDMGALIPGAGSTAVHLGPSLKMNIEETNREGLNMLCMATRRGHFNTIKLLLDHGARAHGALFNPSGNMACGITPLWLAARLAECAPVAGNTRDANGIASSPELVVDLLLKNGAGADINTLSGPGQTPLVAAAGAGRVGVVRLLIEAGAEVNQPDMHELTPLMHACHYGHLEVVLLLLNNGALADPRPGKISALIFAADGGHDRIVSLLIARGADIDHADETGATALIIAVRARKTSTVKLLISLGANLQHIDDNGRTALDYAPRARHHDIRQLLEQGSPPPRDH